MGRQPLQPTGSINTDTQSNNGSDNRGKTIEEMYQKKTQLEHILLRPDTYVGSIEKHKQKLWVYEGGQMVHREIEYCPGLYKIFDEILVNAADNKQRDPSMNSVKVDIDVEDNRISVYNNGDGVPVEIHQEEKVYVPELIFGHLLTSSNYDDNEKKTTGGRNGYGAKLANIFSTEFIIETADGKRRKKYKQVFKNNMGVKMDPIITSCKEGENWTKVTFKPDLSKFNMTQLEDDVVALMSKRAVDIAGCLGKTVNVELNGKKLPVKTFQDYVNLYVKAKTKPNEEPSKGIFEKGNPRWEVCMHLSFDGQFQQVSFVNSISTIKGGAHVDYITNQITTHIQNIMKKKDKNSSIKPHHIKGHLWVFVNSLIDNPAFDSQTKETLTTRHTSFGSKCNLSPEFLKSVAKSGVIEQLESWAEFKKTKDQKKTDGSKRQRLTGITKLDDANDAGTKNSDKCTLILTEGDSAKALAMAGISVVGRNHYGVFPLRGKLLNVREASHKQIMENAEIQHIKQILGLQTGKEYENVKSLRYGHLMIMTDQDHDGSHIKGLLINFIHSFWPSLLKIPSFLVEFITPIVKVTNVKNKKRVQQAFYNIPEFETWKETIGEKIKDWDIKYYKGLGTSTNDEGKQYFKDIDRHKKDFRWADDHDGNAIEMAFSKKKIEARKSWLRQFEPGTFLDPKEKVIKYSDFVNKELILFSMADLQRSIPSMVDGFKPGQRKILFCAFKKKIDKEIKIAQFAGYVSEHSAYHHGEMSLTSTIIGMAQDFVGSNNINLLLPKGQFGTRAQGGKDHASGRYIYTSLSPLARKLFPKDDDVLLDYLNDDGLKIEPSWYVPIIPLVLANGSEGIGTGWSSYVPNYNPRDIVANIRHLLNNKPLEPMDPWYKGFKGTIEHTATKDSGVTYTLTGIIEEVNSTTLRILELPIRKWTQDYKEFLEVLMTGNDKIKEPFIRDYKEYSTNNRVYFEVFLSEENMNIARQEGLLKKFRLTTTISTSNMHLFDRRGIIQKFDTPEQILKEFFDIRFEFYEKRKKAKLQSLEFELVRLENKVRFILGVVNGEIIVNNRKRKELAAELRQKGFTPISKSRKELEEAATAGAQVGETNEDDPSLDDNNDLKDYEYLMSMPIGSLTLERVQSLLDERDRKEGEVVELKKTTPRSLWDKDLDEFILELDNLERIEASEDEKELNSMNAEAARVFKLVPKHQRTIKSSVAARQASDDASQSTTQPSSSLATANTQPDVPKPKRGGGRKAAAAKKKMDIDLDDDEDLDIGLQQNRLAAYNEDSSPDGSVGNGSDRNSPSDEVVPKQREAPKRAAKKAVPVYDLDGISDEDDGDAQMMETIPEEIEEVAEEVPKKGGRGRGKKAAMIVSDDENDSDFDISGDKAPKPKKGTKKAPAAKPKAPPKPKKAAEAPAQKKRGAGKAQGDKMVAEFEKLKVDSSDIPAIPAASNNVEPSPYKKSPEKKVRKMRTSPFNKKSGSIMSKLDEEDENKSPSTGGSSGGSAGSSSSNPEEGNNIAAPARRPVRARKAPVKKYVISDDSEEDEVIDVDDPQDDDYSDPDF